MVLAVWAFAGSIPERISVPGVMTRPGAVVEVFAEAAGTVSAVSVVTGQTVATGTPSSTMTGEDGSQLDVVSTIDGVVQGVSARAGLIVSAGTSMATIVDEASDAPLRALAYLNPADIQSLGVTDRVTVAPAAVNGTKYGSLVGHVTFVGDVPASIPEMGEELGSTALAQEFSQATGGISYLVIVEFDDPADVGRRRPLPRTDRGGHDRRDLGDRRAAAADRSRVLMPDSHLDLRQLEHAVAGRARAVVARATHAFHRSADGVDGADGPSAEDAAGTAPQRAAQRTMRRSPVKTPTVLQMEAVECGAASLAMVLAYFGRYVPLTELRRECGVSRDGSKATHIATAARNYGLEVHPRRLSREALATTDVPCILWWQFNHFVVFEGFVGDDAQINDPAVGRVRIPPNEFDRSFTGIGITLAPTDQFERGGRRHRAMASLTGRTRRLRAGLTLAIVAGLLATIPALVAPIITGVFVDGRDRPRWTDRSSSC